MAHTLFRLTESLFSKPLLMTQDSCSEVLSYLDFRNTSSMAQLTNLAVNADKVAGKQTALSENGVGTINILGPISTFKTGFEALCNNASHEFIVEQAETLFADDSVDTVLLNIRSGGGQAHKTFESAMRLKELSQQSGKRLITYIDEMACSAAYAYAVAADEVVINPTATAGSIGVLLQMMNDSKALEKEGYERVFITSSDGKVPYAKDGSFREEFLEDMQESVSELFDGFVSHVATLRNLDPDVIRNSNAGVYSADKAKELGFVDSIMTTNEFYEYLATSRSNVTSSTNSPQSQASLVEDVNITQLSKTNQEETLMSETINTEQFAELQSQMDAQAKLNAEQAAMIASFQAKETEAAKAELSEQLDNSPFLSESKEQLLSFFMSADTPEGSKTLMNSVIASCNAETTKIKADADALAVTASEELQTALADKEAIKEEFATSTTTVELAAKDVKSPQETLKANVAAAKAARNK